MYTLFAVIVWAIYGLIVGLIARGFYGKGPDNVWRLIGIGIAGSYVGGIIHAALFGTAWFAPSGIVLSIIGAIICCALYHKYLENNND